MNEDTVILLFKDGVKMPRVFHTHYRANEWLKTQPDWSSIDNNIFAHKMVKRQYNFRIGHYQIEEVPCI